jgi:hypothetical protein
MRRMVRAISIDSGEMMMSMLGFESLMFCEQNEDKKNNKGYKNGKIRKKKNFKPNKVPMQSSAVLSEN